MPHELDVIAGSRPDETYPVGALQVPLAPPFLWEVPIHHAIGDAIELVAVEVHVSTPGGFEAEVLLLLVMANMYVQSDLLHWYRTQ